MATAQDDQAWLAELAKQNGGIGVGETDLANLQGKNPEDRAQFQSDLTTQYGVRNASKGGGGNESSTQQWNTSGGSGGNSLFPSWYSGLMANNVQQNLTDSIQAKGRSDNLYGQLAARGQQGLNVNPNDPIIKGQVDAFNAAQQRSGRDYLGQAAESQGPLANLRGEQRMAQEKIGQNTGSFQAELMSRELGARRDEIQNALSQQGAMLSGDQQRNLQGQLAQMNQALGEANAQTSRTGMENQFTLGQGQLALGRDSLALQKSGQAQNNDQFLRELALRQWDTGDQSDYRWASLGG
jgi:hypothetical protein